MVLPSRYAGKPLLRLLEFYVLKAIHELSAADEAALHGMTPNLSRIYGTTGSWSEIIATVMDLPPELPVTILQMWERNQVIANGNSTLLTPQRFAEMFVDQNLASERRGG